MSTFHRIQDIRVWHLASQLAEEIYRLSDSEPFRSDGPLRNQIRRASVSIASNIAEGFERDGNKEFIHFLSLAKGSAGEVFSQLYKAWERRYCDDRTFYRLKGMTVQTLCMLDSLITHLRTSEFLGRKFMRN